MANLDKIRTLAKSKGLSLSYICTQIGVARVYFIDVERYNRTIPEERLQKIADILGTTVDYLTDQTDSPDKNEKPTAISDELWDVIQNDPKTVALFELLIRADKETMQKMWDVLEGE